MRYFRSIILVFLFINLITLSSLHAEDKKPVKVKKKKISVSLLSLIQKINEVKGDESFYKETTSIAVQWFPLISSIREGRLERIRAIDSMNIFTNRLWDYMEALVNSEKIRKYTDDEWIFPVKGYNARAIGGSRGSGYVVSNFDFFDLNTGGHPAHDLFIDDGNQDCLDDQTNEPVEILSMSGGIVVETRKTWTPAMTDIKGGNIVYVYDNYTNGFFYYAHLKDVYVNIGDFVTPGTPLGTMGRTGKNAYPSRSPTHLHIMYVRSFDGDLRPENIYNDLLKAKLIP